MTKPSRDHDRKMVRRVLRLIELRMRNRERRFQREVLDAVTAVIALELRRRGYDADEPKKG